MRKQLCLAFKSTFLFHLFYNFLSGWSRRRQKKIRINKTRSQIIYTYCKCIIPTNEKKTEHEKMLLKIQYRETEQWNEFSENHQRAEVLNRMKTVAGVGFFPLHLMHFYIQLATVNKFTYCVIWYFNIILSPLFLSVLFSLSLALARCVCKNYSVDGFSSFIRRALIGVRDNNTAIVTENARPWNKHAKKNSKTFWLKFLLNCPEMKWTEQKMILFFFCRIKTNIKKTDIPQYTRKKMYNYMNP